MPSSGSNGIFGHWSIQRRLQLGPVVLTLALAAVVIALEITQASHLATRSRAIAAEQRVVAIASVDRAMARSSVEIHVALGLVARGQTDETVDAKLDRAVAAIDMSIARARHKLADAVELRRSLIAYRRLAMETIETVRGRTADPAALLEALLIAHRQFDEIAHAMEVAAIAVANEAHAEAVRTGNRGTLTIEIVVALALTTTLATAAWTYRSIVSPICRMQRRMATLAGGDLDTPIPEQQRRDEIGSMAAALDHFRNTAQMLHRFAFFDQLTGLANRAHCRDRIKRAVAESERFGHPFALLLLDIDHFKEVNETIGHDAGDALLRQVGTRLQSVVRATDTAARLGGDEFAIVQERMESIGDSEALANRIIEAIAAPFSVADNVVHLSVSVGVATCPRDGIAASDLMKNADLALQEAKLLKRQSFCSFEQRMSDAVVDRRSLESRLRKALAEGAISFVFQPKRCLSDRAIVGVETLARWPQDDGTRISPAAFVPVAEQTGLIGELGVQALDAACREMAAWRGATGSSLTVAVNLSVAQFKHANLPRQVESALTRHGLESAALILELTESLFVDHEETTLRALGELGEMGVRLALDDFGTGYASLGYLRRLPFSELKIDKSFVRDVDTHADALSITRAIISLGHALDMRITAEGIENEAQLRRLQLEGCDVGQGHLLGHPVEPAEIGRLLDETPPPPTRRREAGGDKRLVSAGPHRL